MKKNTTLISTVTVIAVLTMVVSVTSCKKEDDGKSLKVDLTHPIVSIEDAKKQPPVGEKTLLWNNDGHVPILDPEGRQVTLGEFNRVSGYARIKCVNSGTQVVIHVKGLIPKGVYSMWVATFKSPGFDETWNNATASGALGPANGSQNAFTASENGTAALSVFMPSGPLSEFGSVGNCLPSEKDEVHLFGAYHLDHQTHGPSPGGPGTWVVQFDFPL